MCGDTMIQMGGSEGRPGGRAGAGTLGRDRRREEVGNLRKRGLDQTKARTEGEGKSSAEQSG